MQDVYCVNAICADIKINVLKRSQIMNIQKIKIENLKPAKYNPRKDLKPDDEEYKKIKRSIVEFGYVAPVIVNKDMTVIGGHQRLKVLK